MKFKLKDKNTTYSKTIIRANLIIILFAIVLTFVIEINNWKNIESEFATKSALLAKRHNSYFSQVMYTCRFIVDKGRTGFFEGKEDPLSRWRRPKGGPQGRAC